MNVPNLPLVNLQVEIAAAKLIQKEVRRYLKIRRVERFLAAAIKIQTVFRGYIF